GTKPGRALPQWKAEYGPDACFQGLGCEGEPTGGGGVGKIGFEHHLVVVVGVDARPLTQRELELVDQTAHTVRGAERPLWQVTRHKHGPGAGHADDVRCDLTQASGRPLPPTLGLYGGDDPLSPITGHSKLPL